MKMNLQESSHYYDSEKYYNQSPGIAAGSPDLGGWEPGMGDDSLHSIPVRMKSLDHNDYDGEYDEKNLAWRDDNKDRTLCRRNRLALELTWFFYLYDWPQWHDFRIFCFIIALDRGH